MLVRAVYLDADTIENFKIHVAMGRDILYDFDSTRIPIAKANSIPSSYKYRKQINISSSFELYTKNTISEN
jgi:hypothetical protein